jgi:hypothetical protein|tara:strand:+ start:35 stop:490 length:456 start_codon:yes stop_codon:yes gene_type:complete
MASRYYRGFEKLFKFGKSAGENTGKSINTIVGVPPAKNLIKKKEASDKLIKARDKILKGTSDETKLDVKTKNPLHKYKEKIRKIVDKKANGGRIGRRFGSPNPKKTNVQKIKETFAPKKKNLSPKQMKIAKLAGDPKRIDARDLAKLRGRG